MIQSPSVMLRDASRLIEHVTDLLNIEHSDCAHCSVRRYHNFREHTMFQTLDGMIQRIDKMAAQIEAEPLESQSEEGRDHGSQETKKSIRRHDHGQGG